MAYPVEFQFYVGQSVGIKGCASKFIVTCCIANGDEHTYDLIAHQDEDPGKTTGGFNGFVPNVGSSRLQARSPAC